MGTVSGYLEIYSDFSEGAHEIMDRDMELDDYKDALKMISGFDL